MRLAGTNPSSLTYMGPQTRLNRLIVGFIWTLGPCRINPTYITMLWTAEPPLRRGESLSEVKFSFNILPSQDPTLRKDLLETGGLDLLVLLITK